MNQLPDPALTGYEGDDYCACYCEENIYRLCAARQRRRQHKQQHNDPSLQLAGGDGGDDTVVFISSPSRCVPVWAQRLGDPVFWDYHVILVSGDLSQVFDFDSTLPFPCPSALYVTRTLRPRQQDLPPDMRHRFRLVAAADYLAHFCSDRAHMRDEGGAWRAPPPPWPPIHSSTNNGDIHSNLGEYLDVSVLGAAPPAAAGRGRVLDRAAFFAWALRTD